MKKISLFLLAMASVFLMAACSSPAEPDSEPPVDTPPADEVVVTPEPQNEAVVITVAPADDALQAQYPSVIDATSDEEYAVDIILSTNTAVQNFRHVAIEYVEEGETIVFSTGETLYSLDTLQPDAPLMVSTEFPGVFPTTGIVFTDETGTDRCFLICLSGQDGSIFLDEASAF